MKNYYKDYIFFIQQQIFIECLPYAQYSENIKKNIIVSAFKFTA